ncbi:tRNA-uridine aminocarboxypropyltransferase [Zavarzinia sp. CC-PAN008]|uniref:tRNA-uridine aminocarboxypropyltransferase n=1 Tax=Zavarzinia sp. CC-PAN008 TaxID=3243332 RepID=UPI003F749F8C
MTQDPAPPGADAGDVAHDPDLNPADAPVAAVPAIVPVPTRLRVVVLQHPQEKREALATAPLIAQVLPQATIKVGLSWPSLKAVLEEDEDPYLWGVLYLGSREDSTDLDAPLTLLDRHGERLSHQRATLGELQGIVALDGTWSQAKTLWWRNPWLLKLRRIVLNPPAPSAYGKVRREPRREALSTLEAVAMAISQIERRPSAYDQITAPLADLIQANLRPPRAARGRRRPPQRKPKATPSSGD